MKDLLAGVVGTTGGRVLLEGFGNDLHRVDRLLEEGLLCLPKVHLLLDELIVRKRLLGSLQRLH